MSFKSSNMDKFRAFWGSLNKSKPVHMKTDWDKELDELNTFYEEQQKRYYRPESVEAIVEKTRFSRKEVQALYRGFKETCPSATISREQFKEYFIHIFPYGADSSYADYVFETFDLDHNGVINFEEFVQTLSAITRGSSEEKFEWIFSLYDLDHSGFLTRSNVMLLVQSIYLLLGNLTSPPMVPGAINDHADLIWRKLSDGQRNERVTKDEFINKCQKDPEMLSSLRVLEVVI